MLVVDLDIGSRPGKMGIIMTETTTTTATPTTELIVAAFTEDQYTPYQLAMKVNSLFEQLGADKRIPTQMAYNYVRNNLIKGVSKTTVPVKNSKKEGKTMRDAVVISREGAVEWAVKYITKNLPK
jgi:hypothetical protein